jgi:fermentation-respiration switch protein FrsA (DUF1100 family)
MIRKKLLGPLVALVLGCAAFVYGLRWLEAAMTFRPSRMAAAQAIPRGAENVWFNSADGTRLNGWFFSSQTKPELATMIFFHGNGGAVVLESGFSSASSVATSALPWLPRFLHFLGKNRFESARKLNSVRCPILIAHGDPDRTIPTSEAQLLYAAANEPKRLLVVPGAGHVVFGSAGGQYLDEVEQFMRESIRARQ